MQRKNYKAYFTVEAAVLYPIVLGVIVLMTYLLFFQYDRCLLEQDMGRAAVRSGSRWMQKKEELNRQLQEKDMFFDTEKYIAWESELPVWKLEKNQVTVEQTGRMPYPFSEIAEVPRYWSAKAAFQVKRNNPVEILRNSQRYRGKTEETTESEKKYQYCMISRGGIKGLLPCSLRYIDGEAYLYYDITSRQNIAQLFEKKPITRQWIMDFLWSMRRVRQEMSRFLLEESNIVWFPQHVYQDLEKKEFYFIYVPYCTENTGFDELMEYLVEHVDYQDESLVEYVYKAYEQYESAGEVYLQAKIFEDAECLRIPEKMDAVEEETTVVVGQDQEKDAIREEEKEKPEGEDTEIKEKKGL